MLPWSVIPIAGWPSAAAAATTSSTRAAPSSIEYSVWTWRWVKLSPTGGLLGAAGRCSTVDPQRFFHRLWMNHTAVISTVAGRGRPWLGPQGGLGGSPDAPGGRAGSTMSS